MSHSTVVLLTRFGLGHSPAELQQKMAGIFLSLLAEAEALPGKLLFYTDGVKLVCEGSPVIEQLRALEAKGVELIVCSTCLNYFGLMDKVQVGGGSSCNRAFYNPHVRFTEGINVKEQMLLFDAQTSGGLLLAVPPDKLGELLDLFVTEGQPGWVIGQVVTEPAIEVIAE